METLIYIHDQFMKGEEATLSPLDLSVLRGFGVMDYLRTYGKEPFRLRAHLKRFVFSAHEIGLTVPKSIEEMERVVEGLIERGGYPETSIKVVLTGGVSEDQLMPQGAPTFFAVAYPFKPFPEHYFREGIKITTACYHRPFPQAKSIAYLPAIMALKKGDVDVLFYNEKEELLETGTANFFALKEGKIITPKEGILDGITRQVVQELVDVEERTITKKEINTFDGAFLTSSNKEVMPVVQIDNVFMNNGVIPFTILDLMQSFANHTKKIKKKSLQIN